MATGLGWSLFAVLVWGPGVPHRCDWLPKLMCERTGLWDALVDDNEKKLPENLLGSGDNGPFHSLSFSRIPPPPPLTLACRTF